MTDPFAPEREALAAIAAAARAQRQALADASIEAFETAAARTLDAVAELDRRRRDRVRFTARTDAPAATAAQRTALETTARDARAACDALEGALDHAVTLGRDLVGAWRRLSAPPTANVYTARGAVGAPVGRGAVRT
ncbi:hypothetical protein [Rubrivirga sp. IMCC43871]|uniref:hypothetical protein n=1 Tax=Rubrivirga sp. IMCC43871 TaxID=3391575 RepID=UPI00398FE668